MLETASDLERLQALLDASAAGAGAHLRSAFAREERWLSAAELVEELDGIVEVHLAVAARDGAPLVAPVDAVLLRGRLWIGLPPASVRARLVRRDPRVSASFVRDDFGLIAHGTFVEVDEREAESAGYVSLVRELYSASLGDWFGPWFDQQRADPTKAGVTGYLEPRVLFAKR